MHYQVEQYKLSFSNDQAWNSDQALVKIEKDNVTQER
jgi:hypothetical protein